MDASVVLDWAFDERDTTAAAVRDRLTESSAIAPSLWWYEVRNGLIAAERRGRHTAERSALFLVELAQFSVELDRVPDDGAIMELARRHHLTFYDAAYLELAMRQRLPLASLDKALAAAAQREGVEVLA